MLVNVGYVALLAFGAAATGYGLVVPVFAAGVIVVRTVAGGAPDRLGARRTAVAATAISAAGLLALSATHGAGALASTAVIALGQALAVPALGLLVLARVPTARHGAAAGLFFAFFDAGVAVGGPLTGLVARATSPAGALAVAGGAVACAGLSQAPRVADPDDDRMTPDLTALLSSLVAADSVNPSLVAGGAGEREIAGLIEDWGRDAGLETERLEETPGRPSVLVRARGSGGGRSLLLCGHIDTVNVEGMADPHAPRVEGDRLYGRGAYDMKAGVAAALLAAREAARLGLAGDVVVAAVADEEHASLGVREALRRISADAAVVTEPTELELAVAHKGFVWSEIEVTGRSAHGSRPHVGIDAILKMGAVLHELQELDRSLAGRVHLLLGRASVHASLIEGGVELSSYPARCKLGLERRTLPGETRLQIEAELASLLERCREADPAFEASQRTLLVREPFEIEPEHELVALVAEAAALALPGPAEIGGVSYWADAAFIAAAGIPTVLFGPGGEGAHAIEEWVSLSDTEAVVRTLVGVAARFCA